jgi:signal recognition particle subunit SRP54
MGGVRKLVSAMPGGDQAMAKGQIDEGALDRMETVIYSMTQEERDHPEVLNGSRRARIAAGAGVQVQDVNWVIKQYNETKKMFKQFMAVEDQMPGNRKQRRSKNKKKGKKGKKGNAGRRAALPGGMSMRDLRKMQSLIESGELGDLGDLGSTTGGGMNLPRGWNR